MNPEEKDFQIEDTADFNIADDDQSDLTPEITDFDEPQSEPEEVETGEEDSTDTDGSSDEIINLSTNTEIGEVPDQKETSPSQPRVMRYEDFVKNT